VALRGVARLDKQWDFVAGLINVGARSGRLAHEQNGGDEQSGEQHGTGMPPRPIQQRTASIFFLPTLEFEHRLAPLLYSAVFQLYMMVFEQVRCQNFAGREPAAKSCFSSLIRDIAAGTNHKSNSLEVGNGLPFLSKVETRSRDLPALR